jgi:hypothetical protein
LIAQVLLFAEDAKVFDSFLELLLHDGGATISEDLEFLDDLHVDLEGVSPL